MKNSQIGVSYTLPEEIFSSILHGIGALLSISALVVMLVFNSKNKSAVGYVSFAVYGATLIILYLCSTLYHSLTNKKAKFFFRRMDHVSICLLIGGTYTPICLLGLKGTLGWVMCSVIWGLAILEIIYEVLFLGRHKWISLAFYIPMGWMALFMIKPLIERTPSGFLWWLFLGGLIYSCGIVFYAKKSIRYYHSIWHLFVLAGSIFHFIGIFCYFAQT